MSLLTVERIEKSYFGRKVLDEVSFRLDRGERLALIGGNGAGKTTLMRLITGSETPDSGRIILSGQVIPAYLSQMQDTDRSDDQSPLLNPQLVQLENELRALEHDMAATLDDPAEHLRVMARYSEKTAAFEALGGYDFTRRITEALRGLGLDDDVIGRPISSLSGGEKMRVSLARILLRDPDLLLLDEPTNHLDLDAMEWLEQFLVRFKGAVLLISHDRTFIDRTATSVAELESGRLVLRPGNYSRFREIEAAEQLTVEREIKKVERELAHQKSVTQTMLSHRKMSSYHAREKVVAKVTEELGRIRDRSTKSGQKILFSFLPTANEGDPQRILLKTDALSCRFGDRVLFRDASFHLRCGEKLFLLGPNGCGKSTLLSILLGRSPADSGTVSLSSRSVFGHMSQEFAFPDESATVLQTLLTAYDLGEGQARSLLAKYGFRDVDVYKQVHVLSGGERARLYLCHLLLDRPDLLFLDEPTNHLDIRSREILESALLDYTGALLVVSHDRYLIERLASRVLGFIGTSVLPFDHYQSYQVARDRYTESLRQKAEAARTDARAGAMPPLTELVARIDNPVRRGGSDPIPEMVVEDDRQEENRARVRQNRAQERRTLALRKERIRQVERSIEQLEATKHEMEQSFASSSDPALYQDYARLTQQLEDTYAEYLSLSEESDD